MRKNLSPFAASLLVLPLAAVTSACSDDASISDTTPDTEGIEASISGTASSTGDIETTGAPDPSDGSSSDGSSSTSSPSDDPCMNGEQDGDESDVDCGGSCDPCPAGGKCESDEDCETMICGGGFCQSPTCYDEIQNGNEEGVDCGGSCPNSCVDDGCTSNNQCDAGQYCDTDEGICKDSSCDNGVLDTQETDVDCGGPDCPDCPDGSTCEANIDCESGNCDDGTCASPSCDDGVQNADETDIDCGGASCPVCPLGADCMVNEDCIELVCEFGVCTSADCSDDVLNGDETDVDCGGPMCAACPVDAMCVDNADCMTSICNDGVCAGAVCDDGVRNGDETDTDCGGACGATCVPGQQCDNSGDCVEGVCEFGLCSEPACNDGVQNGDETDVDCGGSCGATCEPSEACSNDGDCVELVCDPVDSICSNPTCMDTVQNQDETDVDCGGVCGATCDPTQACFDDDDCVHGVCAFAECLFPACDDGVQNGDELGIDCAGSCPLPCPIGDEVVVNTTTADFQVHPAIAAAPDGSYYVVVWASFPFNDAPQDGDGAGIFAQMYDAAGLPLGGEFQVNTSTAGNQQFPAVDAGNDGFVVTWQSFGTDGDGQGVYAQRYDADGVAQGTELQVNTTTVGDQRRPDVAVAGGGSFVICWEGSVSTFEIFCQRFSSSGTPSGGQFQVNSETNNSQALPVVEAASTGEFTVVWQSAGDQDGDGTGVFLRRFEANGTPIGSGDLQVNTFSTGDQNQPAIAMAPTGAHVVVWSSGGQDGSSTGVYGQRYASTGAMLGGEFQVNSTTSGAQNNPAVAMNSSGQFIVVFQTSDDGALTGVFGQRYLADGNPLSIEFGVNQLVAGLQEVPEVVLRGSDEIVTVYTSGDASFTDRDIVRSRTDGQFP